MKRAAPDPAAEFRVLFDALLDFASRHPVAGPRIAGLGVAGRGVFPDVKLVLNLSPAAPKARAKGSHLQWSWGPAQKGFAAQVLVSCPAALANRLCQGKENPARSYDRGDLTITPLDPSVNEGRLLDLLPVLVPLRTDVVAALRKAGLERFVL